MSENFIKLTREEEAQWLLKNHGNCFLLLTLISTRARRTSGHPDGLIIGDALLGSTDLMPSMSRQNFRTALDKLVEFGYIKIIANGKTFFEREKSTIKVTIKGMLVNLVKSTVYDINPEVTNQQVNQQLTNDQPTANHKQERIRKKKKEKEDTSTKAPPSKSDGDVGGISFNFEIGSFENISPDDISSWKMTYPDVDVQPQIRQMQEWVMADPKNNERKSWKRFIVGWLSRNQEKMAIAKKMNPQQKSRSFLGGKEQVEYNNAW